MIERTQSNLSPGNCWQTVVACLLEVEPETLPDQVELEALKKPYSTILNEYLRHHHGKALVSVYEPALCAIRVADPGWHTMTGPTVRTATNSGICHVVVGRYGKMVWDPHPSRAGLIAPTQWGLLVPYPAEWEEYRTRQIEKGATDRVCLCPSCVAGRS